MDFIECNNCKKKYTLNLEKIPQTPKKWKCSHCQFVAPFPFYSEKEQEFLLKVNIVCNSCNKKYTINSGRFISSQMKVMCSSCKQKFPVSFPNFENMQRLNQKIPFYLNKNENSQSKIFKEDKQEFQSLIKEVIPEIKQKKEQVVEAPQISQKQENFDDWEDKIKKKKGVVSPDLRSNFFLSNNKEQKLERSDLPSLPTKKKKAPPQRNMKTGFFFFTLFLFVVIIYIYFLNVL
jgi:transposase-like protein